MTVPEFLTALADEGGRLAAREGRLRFHGPRDLFTDEMRAILREHEAALVGFLARRTFTADELDALGYLGEPDGTGGRKVTMLGPREFEEALRA